MVTDSEGWPIIQGRAGRIEWHDDGALAVYTDRRRMFEKLWAIPGVRRLQTGDTEMRALFLPDALPQVARVIGAKRKRRGLSSETARKLGAATAYRAASATNEPSAWPGRPFARSLWQRPSNEPCTPALPS